MPPDNQQPYQGEPQQGGDPVPVVVTSQAPPNPPAASTPTPVPAPAPPPAPEVSPQGPATVASPVPPPAPEQPAQSKEKKPILKLILLGLLFVLCVAGAYFVGKHGERVVIKPPTPPPITLPPQAVVVAQCVPGLGKQYVIPKDIPNGPIYDVQNSKVIAVEYNYKAVDLFLNPERLSNTIIPFTKSYQIDHFITTIGELKAGTLQDAQSVPIHLIIYVVPKTEAQKITCPKSG